MRILTSLAITFFLLVLNGFNLSAYAQIGSTPVYHNFYSSLPEPNGKFTPGNMIFLHLSYKSASNSWRNRRIVSGRIAWLTSPVEWQKPVFKNYYTLTGEGNFPKLDIRLSDHRNQRSFAGTLFIPQKGPLKLFISNGLLSIPELGDGTTILFKYIGSDGKLANEQWQESERAFLSRWASIKERQKNEYERRIKIAKLLQQGNQFNVQLMNLRLGLVNRLNERARLIVLFNDALKQISAKTSEIKALEEKIKTAKPATTDVERKQQADYIKKRDTATANLATLESTRSGYVTQIKKLYKQIVSQRSAVTAKKAELAILKKDLSEAHPAQNETLQPAPSQDYIACVQQSAGSASYYEVSDSDHAHAVGSFPAGTFLLISGATGDRIYFIHTDAQGKRTHKAVKSVTVYVVAADTAGKSDDSVALSK